MNYRDLNEIIIENKYFLSLLFKTLNRFAYIKYFIKINIRNTYYYIHIREKKE